ncbi:MAG: DNA mismatch repair protein MutS [Hyphomicrobiaceae bacterium]|nr:DNA mismatch repair protein MutS [Hyphomicrobiaceae bacterium]
MAGRKPSQPDDPNDAAEPSPVVPDGVTPSMAQFLEIKAANPDSILWYRMGDFYELFFEDAVAASRALSIVLTKRGKHLGDDIPMCGVPIHRADEYLQRLIKLGYRVAVCEQLEDPAEARKRGAKAVVRRDVVRLVTPGTLTEETLLDAKARNYLTAIYREPGPEAVNAVETRLALASLDISTGEFEVGEVSGADLAGEMIRLSPGEVLLGDGLAGDGDVKRWIAWAGAAMTPVPSASFDSLAGERNLKSALGVADLAAFGGFTRAELAAIGALLRYIELTQLGAKPVIRPPRKTGAAGVLMIDASSRTSLELTRSTSGEKQGSLLSAIDRTVTGAGARELAARLSSPLQDVAAIQQRLDAVGALADDESLRGDLREILRGAPDVARSVSRLAFARGGPRDLGAVRDGLAAARQSHDRLTGMAAAGLGPPEDLAGVISRLGATDAELGAMLGAALIEAPPHLKRDGGFVKPGWRAELDEVRQLKDDSRKVLAELEAQYIGDTGIKTLKIRHNNILGYFIEVTQQNARPMLSEPLSDTFRHKQTMANAVRFTTRELSDIEGRIASAGERALAIELDVFTELSARVSGQEHALSAVSAALAELDHIAALAELAQEQGWVRPQVDTSDVFEIRGGRHPVVEQALRQAKGSAFIENDCVLGRAAAVTPPGFDEEKDARIWLVTGPNMAGKSTFLRQNALIAVLAQMGSYVPARSAHIGVVDRLFSRVGAADDLARGRSTFMVEMVETAGILNQSTARSLVILDEIGRGTATFDGLSIAWATVEYLHDVSGCRSLFATHYHELTALAGRMPHIANVTMDVTEWHDEIVFLHKVKRGAAAGSYGIQVAKLAGMPGRVVKRAGEVLALLEKNDRRGGAGRKPLAELPLFAAMVQADDTPARVKASEVELELDKLQPDTLTPRQALDALYVLKQLRTSAAKPKK